MGARESKKGDVARAVYYYTMYPTKAPTSPHVAIWRPLRLARERPADAGFLSRNTKINLAQGNKNPYVDNPTWCTAWLYDGTLPNDDTEGPDFTGTRVQ